MEPSDNLSHQIVDAAKPARRDPRKPLRVWLRASSSVDRDEQFLDQLAADLSSEGRACVRFRLPDGILDAGEHLLGQLCTGFDLSRLPRASFETSHPLHKRISWVSRGFGIEKAAPILLLRVPESWLLARRREFHALPDKPSELLKALLNGSGLDAVVVTNKKTKWLADLLGDPLGSLPEDEVGVDVLFDASRWGQAADQARELAEKLKVESRPLSHIELAVACTVLGYGAREVEQALVQDSPLFALIELMREKLKSENAWQPLLRRIFLARFPIPRIVLEDIIGPMTAQQRIFMDCVLVEQSDGKVMPREQLRKLVFHREGEPAANERLADYYKSLDGVSSAEEALRRQSIVPWLERGHHLVHSGPKGVQALNEAREIIPLSRMSLYELAWSLSYEYRHYELAAGVYKQLCEMHSRDSYSHHYWAWNLDQAGKDFATALREYREALRIEPENPWYNGRYITFLRDNGYQREAREAWREGWRIVSAGKWADMQDLPEQLHRWVARSALDAGDLLLARDVLSSLSPDQRNNPKLSSLQHELEHFEEIDRLGESLYPFDVPMKKRWKQRYLVPDELTVDVDGQRSKRRKTVTLQSYFPGRAVSIDAQVFTLLLAKPKENPPALFTMEISEDDLRRVADGHLPNVGQYVELGHYENDIVHVRCYAGCAGQQDRATFNHSLRYFRDEKASEGG